jgi:membrane protein
MVSFKKLLSESFDQWSKHDCSSLGAALSYYAVLSLAPLLTIAVAIAGLAFRKEDLQTRIMGQVTGLMGQSGASAFGEMFGHATSLKANSAAIAVGFIVLLFSASGVFTELRTALNVIWDVKPKKSGWRQLVQEEFFSFAMVLGIGFLLLVSLVASTALAGLSKVVGAQPPGPVAHVLNALVSIIVTTLLFAFIYRVVPEQTLPWGRLWPGSFATAVLFTAGKFLLALYLTRAGVGSVYGAAGSLVVLLVWLYYSALIFLFGAEFTRVYACERDGVCLNIAQDGSTAAGHQQDNKPVPLAS